MPVILQISDGGTKQDYLDFASGATGSKGVDTLLFNQPGELPTDPANTISRFNTIMTTLKAEGLKIWVSIDLSPAPGANFDILSPPATPSWFTDYLAAIELEIASIDKVFISWSHCKCCGGYERWVNGNGYNKLLNSPQTLSITPTLQEFQALAAMAPNVNTANKLAFTSIAIPFEREAKLFEGDLGNATLLQWLITNNVAVMIPRGHWVLDANITEHHENFGSLTDAQGTRSPILHHRASYADPGVYPYTYYTDYIKSAGAEFYSEVGFNAGIERGNTEDLITAGYKGSVVWALHDKADLQTSWDARPARAKD
jgi:hypothetical protein|tara:strand:- start:1115 stop:2056 length:942 start_codon:yes stop_codon:yes gene_type:complete